MRRMVFIRSSSIICLALFVLIDNVDGCLLPENITGNWYSAHKGDLTITDTSILNYQTTLFLNPALNLTCLVNSGDRYLLKSDAPIDIFGQLTYFFLCLDIYRVTDNMFYYYLANVATPYTNGEPIFGHGSDVDMATGCNRPNPLAVGSFITLVRNGTVDNGEVTLKCPDDMLAIFNNVTITNANGLTEHCPTTQLDVCTNRSKLNFTYDTNCSSTTNVVKSYSDGGVYNCLHYMTDSGTTYLSLWNRDASVDGSGNPVTYRTSCIAFQKVGGTVFATEAPNYCSDSDQTSTTVGSKSGGNILVLTDIGETCLDVESTTTSVTTTTAPRPTASTSIAQFDYIYLLVLLVLVIPLLICVFILIKRCHSRKKNVKSTRKSQECLVKAVAHAELTPVRADKNPPKMFKLHNYQPGDTKTLVPVFKPKIPARISPMFDPEWQPSKLPCLVPLAKVQPLYTDTTEDYLRSRLPRRPSHLSLYSFDSVIFSTEP